MYGGGDVCEHVAGEMELFESVEVIDAIEDAYYTSDVMVHVHGSYDA